MAKKQKIITKASGNIAVFSKNKLKRSLCRAGASPGLAIDIATQVERQISPGMSTEDVYQLAYLLLKKRKEKPTAARYSLKKAIMELGPTGFPFERFVAEVLKRKGYKTFVGKVIKGSCVSHEVDIEAHDGKNHYFIECKFHNRSGRSTDVKVPLYVHSRFQDIMSNLSKTEICHEFHQAWVVTNTHITKSAIKYGECVGMKMIGWRYPRQGGVEKLIEESGLHPITCLISLTYQDKTNLLNSGIVLCNDIPKSVNMLRTIGLGERKISILLKEVSEVCRESNKAKC
jgi:hypothetical protein